MAGFCELASVGVGVLPCSAMTSKNCTHTLHGMLVYNLSKHDFREMGHTRSQVKVSHLNESLASLVMQTFLLLKNTLIFDVA